MPATGTATQGGKNVGHTGGESRNASNQRAVTTAAVVSTLGNLAMASSKYYLGRAYGSLSLTADGLHSAIDVVASLIVLGGVVVSSRKSSRFPYGLYKAENLVSLFVAIAIFAAGFEIGIEAVRAHPAGPLNIPVTGGMALVSSIVSYALSRYKGAIGRRTASPSMTSEGYHSLTEVFSSLAVLAGILGSTSGLPLDRIAAGVVVVFVLYSGWDVLEGSVNVLLDAGLGRPEYRAVEDAISSVPGVSQVIHLTGRNSGRFRFVETAVALRTDSLREAHSIAEQIEEEVKRKVPGVERVFVHEEPRPWKSSGAKVAVPVIDDRGTLAPELGGAPLFQMFVMGEHGPELAGVLPNPKNNLPRQRGLETARWLAQSGVDIVIAKEDIEERPPGLALYKAGVRTAKTTRDLASDAVRDFAEGKPRTPPDGAGSR